MFLLEVLHTWKMFCKCDRNLGIGSLHLNDVLEKLMLTRDFALINLDTYKDSALSTPSNKSDGNRNLL